MAKGRAWARVCLGLVWAAAASSAWAQSADITPENEYKDLIRVSEDIQPLGEHPFGADISLYDGGLSFEQTDVSLAGNGPLLQWTRSFTLRGVDYGAGRDDSPAFGDWDLDLPRIDTLTANQNGVDGWEVGTIGNTNRCSNFAAPPSVPAPIGDSERADWEPATWWQGYHLIIPGQGSQDLLASGDSTYPAVTKSHWRISCLSSTANGQPGEGFLAQAPDGTRYWFNELVYHWAPILNRPLNSGPLSDRRGFDAHPATLLASYRLSLGDVLGWLTGSSPADAASTDDFLRRRDAWMLVTKIEDRFGNTLTYSYDSNGRVTAITASDGRELTVQYVIGSDRIQSVTLQPSSGSPRVWSYAYTGTETYHMQLASVTLPDGHQWQFNLDAFDTQASLSTFGSPGSCMTPGVPDTASSTWTGTITHPSGLVGSFTVKPAKHGRSNVPRECRGVHSTPNDTGSYAIIPAAWYSFTVTQKTFTGAGIPTETWNYTYSPANESWTDDCGSGCASSIWTQVGNPDGSSVKYTFSNRWDATESHLLSTDYYSGNGTGLLRSQSDTYAAGDAGPWPAQAGFNLQNRINSAQTTQYTPLNQRVLTQDGDTYTWQAEAFDAYAQVTKTKRYNSIAGQTPVEEQTTYYNDTNLWVLGLPLQSDNLSNVDGAIVVPITVDRYVYDTSDDTLLGRYHFCTNLLSDADPTHDTFTTCHKVMNYMFNSTGQLASFTDGRSNTTTLGNYKRGIPQSIGYPDGTSQSLSVDDFDQISSITDQADKTTNYSYDSVGRLTGITYPADSVAWYAQTFTYDYVTTAERGLAANHWRRTVARGDARHVTYFDALLRPVLTDTYINGDSTSHNDAETRYDWRSDKTFQSWPTGDVLNVGVTTDGTTTTYDALGRAIQAQQPSELGTLTTTTAYLSGAREQVADPKSNVTTTSYQVFDEPSYDAVIKVEAPESVTQTVTRDLYGNPTTITQGGTYGSGSVSVTKQLYYDDYKRLCRTTEPESGSEVVDYDAAGNIAWSASGLSISGSDCGREQVAAASKTMRSYDAMNRVLTIDYPTGTTDTSFTYDARGAAATATSGIAAWTYTHNALGLLTGETLGIEGYSWPLAYTYDRYGSLDTATYPDGTAIDYATDALGRPTQAGSYATGVSYYPDGALEQFTYLGGAQYLAEQNSRHMLENLTVANGSAFVYSQDLHYDENANLTQSIDLTQGGQRTKTLSYDDLNRLTSATANGLWGTETYSYDPLNNIRGLSGGGISRTYAYDTANRLTAISSGSTTLHSFLYDARGNATQKDNQVRVFDQANRLTQVTGLESYAYDASGRRVKKVAGSTTTYWVYSQAGQVVMQYQPAQALTTDYVYLGKHMIGEVAKQQLLVPASLAADANPNNGSYTMTWSAVPGATSHELQEQVDGGSFVTVYTGGANSKAFSGKAGGSYGYRARGCIGSSCGDWKTSATVGVRPALATVSVPSGTINGTYTVSWSVPPSATSYDVQERKDAGSWTTIASDTAATSISRPGTTSGSYTYQVSAQNSYGSRGWSPVSAAVTVDTTYGVVPTTPSTLTVPATSSTGSITATWSAGTLASSYTLQQSSNGGSTWSTVYTGSALSKALSGLANGSYVYHVQACNQYGCSGWKTSGTLVVTHPPASAPTLTVPSGTNTTGGYTVSWSAVATSTSYTLQEQVNGGSWTAAYTGSALSKALSGKANGSYGYRVEACNVGGCSAWSTTKTITVLHPPGVPASITVPATSSGSLTVSWAAAGTATSYTLRQSIGGAAYTTVYTGTATSKALTASTTGSYRYAVEACNASGCSAYRYSSYVAVTIPPASAPTLTVPGGTDGDGSFSVSWSAVSTATSYTLEEHGVGDSWAIIYTGSAISDARSGLANDSWSYRIQACNAGGCGGWSATKTQVVLHPPAEPASITVPATSSGSLTVSWAAASTATSYTLAQSIDGATYTTAYTGSATSKALSVSTTGSYRYRVQACNAGGCSAYRYSSYVAVTIPPASAPSLTVPSTSGTGSYTVSWGSVGGATSYTLQEYASGGSWATIYTGSSLSKALSGKTDNTWSYRVQACNAGGCGGWSATRSIVVALVPPVPTGLSVYTSGPYYKPIVHLSWNASTDATEYVVEETHPTDGVMTFYDGPNTTAATLVYASGEVKFRVKACDSAGCSAWSGYVYVVLQSGGGPGGPLNAQDADQAAAATQAPPADQEQQP